MTESFYKNVIQKGNQLLIRAIDKGKPVQFKYTPKPTFFVRSKESCAWKTLEGKNVQPVQLASISSARDFLSQYQDQPELVHGMERYPYVWISDNYEGYVDWQMDKILILTLDIEVASENGFPDPTVAEEEVLSITVKNHRTKKLMVWGIYEYKNTRDDVEYVHCIDERQMLEEFVSFMVEVQPDIITGWNTTFFDIPYLAVRITKLFGDKMRNNMSPWNMVSEERTTTFNREQIKYNIWGVANLDYLDLYRKFTYKNQESYRLDYIAGVELGVKKDENPYETYRDWYTNDYQSFIDYNIKDVELVDALEDKMKLIELALTMSYEAKVNYMDVFSQVRMWDVTIYNYLREKNIVVPQRDTRTKGAPYAGAYVKDPQTGSHNWVVSFDLNSLYPHLIMQYNISPETLIEQRFPEAISVDKLLHEEVNTEILGDKLTVTPNSACFRKDIRGFLPNLMEKMYGDRVKFKKYSLEAKQKFENTKDKKYLNDISKYNNIQMARKIALNSAYGAIGNQFFRYYDERLATAITSAGQLSIKWIEKKVNEYLNKILKTENNDYIIASDTDSIYVTFDQVVSKSFGDRDGVPTEKIISFLDQIAKEKIEPYIAQCYQDLADYVKAYEQKMEMAREVIADKGIWTAKKRYILNVYDSEGVKYAEPQLKIMGIEAVKSSTPEPCRDKIKEALKIIINEDEQSLNKFIQSFRKEFMEMEPERIAFPRSCNGLKRWSDRSTIYKKGTPMHVKGALMYNYLLEKEKVSHKYPHILEGEKIKFIQLRTPNKIQTNVISFMNELPREFDLTSMIDYDIMFIKSFVEPMTFILDQIGWQVDRSWGTQRTLEGLFG